METGETANTAALNAPLFRSVIERLHGGGRWVILDLGAAQSGTVSLFSQFRCRLEIADIGHDIDLLNAAEDPATMAEALLPPRREEPVDIVLCWDLLNYLSRPALKALMDGVAQRSRPQTLLHGLIVYSAQRMPVRPGHYLPTEDARLLNVGASLEQRDAPRYSPEDLALAMPLFTVERAMLLRNGMQEFLFRSAIRSRAG